MKDYNNQFIFIAQTHSAPDDISKQVMKLKKFTRPLWDLCVQTKSSVNARKAS